MSFIDEAIINVSGGHGGPGCVSFRRETFIPRGGPDGGEGGSGGNVIFEASHHLTTLQDFKLKRVYQAQNGFHGSGAHKTGKDGKDVRLFVPVGTIVHEAQTGEVLCDFIKHQQSWTACQGGRGGKGNIHFTTSTHQTPRFAQTGEAGESRSLRLVLKLLADVGIIGFPNVGKSTLLSRISNAKPKIGDYFFTTLVPTLGVVTTDDEETRFTAADIPGLVEGAHQGVGLGHRFLRHIERTKVFLHLIDSSSPDFVEQYSVIRKELGLFNQELLQKPEIVLLTKVDQLDLTSPTNQKNFLKAKKQLKKEILKLRSSPLLPGEPFETSATKKIQIEEWNIQKILNGIK